MNETENSEGKDYMFRVNYRDGQGFVEYFLTGGTSLILEMPRESLGYQIHALRRAFEIAYGEPTAAEIAEWETEISRTEEKTEL